MPLCLFRFSYREYNKFLWWLQLGNQVDGLELAVFVGI